MPGRLVKVTDEGGRLSDRVDYLDESLGPCGPSRRRSPDEDDLRTARPSSSPRPDRRRSGENPIDRRAAGPLKHAGTPIGATGANGGVTKLPRNSAVRDPANPGFWDREFGRSECIDECHTGVGP